MATVAAAPTGTRSGTGSAHDVTGEDLRRLAEYPHVVVSWVDDGFPTSVATSLEADPDAGVARLATPAGMPIPDDREVSVVGSHIHPTRGGYDERRYLQLWGRVSEGVRFAPTRAWGWDETEMPFFDDRGYYKRAQIATNDLHLAGVVDFPDIARLTVFADNLVPHVLRLDGVLQYSDELAELIDAVLGATGDEAAIGRVREDVRGLAARFPLYPEVGA